MARRRRWKILIYRLAAAKCQVFQRERWGRGRGRWVAGVKSSEKAMAERHLNNVSVSSSAPPLHPASSRPSPLGRIACDLHTTTRSVLHTHHQHAHSLTRVPDRHVGGGGGRLVNQGEVDLFFFLPLSLKVNIDRIPHCSHL